MPFMKAIQVSAPGADFELVSKEIPAPKEHEVLLKVEACEFVMETQLSSKDIFRVCSIQERLVTKLGPSPNWVRSRIIGR